MIVTQAVRFGLGEPQPGEPLAFKIDMLPTSLNYWSRQFWAVRAKEAKDAKVHVFRAIGARRRMWARMNGPWFTSPVRIVLTYHVGRAKNGASRNLDVDNLVPKHIVDAMKGVLIADDNFKHVPRIEQEIVPIDARGGYTHVLIRPYGRP